MQPNSLALIDVRPNPRSTRVDPGGRSQRVEREDYQNATLAAPQQGLAAGNQP